MLNLSDIQSETYILGLDPGTKNFAYSIIKVQPWITSKGTTLKVGVVKTGLLQNTVLDTKNARKQLATFLLEIECILDHPEFKCSAIVVEQYQSRGHGTKLLELVNIMIGGLFTRFEYREFHFFSAAAWKTAIKQKFDLDGEYKRITCTAHEVDATYIAMYGAFRLLKLKPFVGHTQASLSKIARRVEKVSPIPKRKRKVSNNVKVKKN